VVERGSLENCWRRKALVGSNPTPSVFTRVEFLYRTRGHRAREAGTGRASDIDHTRAESISDARCIGQPPESAGRLLVNPKVNRFAGQRLQAHLSAQVISQQPQQRVGVGLALGGHFPRQLRSQFHLLPGTQELDIRHRLLESASVRRLSIKAALGTVGHRSVCGQQIFHPQFSTAVCQIPPRREQVGQDGSQTRRAQRDCSRVQSRHAEIVCPISLI
jgi:hypothetical protein